VDCKEDGKPWAVELTKPIVATNPLTGRRLFVNLYAAGAELPYLQIEVAWDRLKGNSSAKLVAKNAAVGAPLDAMWTNLGATPLAQSSDVVQAGIHFLEQGTLTLTGR